MWTSVEVVVVVVVVLMGGGGLGMVEGRGDFSLEAGQSLKLLTGLGSAHQSRNSCEQCRCKL